MNLIYNKRLSELSPAELMYALSEETEETTEAAIVAVVGSLYRQFEKRLPQCSPAEIMEIILAFADMTQDAVAICRTYLGFTLLAADPERLVAA